MAKTNYLINPDLAQDKDKALEYNELAKTIFEHPHRFYTTSRGDTVNMLIFRNRVRQRMAGLPEEEQEFMEDLWEELHKNFSKLAVLKRHAFKAYGSKEFDPTAVLEPVKALILELMGQMHSDEEIQEKLAMEGIPTNITNIKKFRQKHKAQVEKLQDDYEKEWHTIGITRKRARLDQLAYMYNKLKRSFDESKGTTQVPYSKEMREILNQVKREVEGDSIHLTVDGKIDVVTTIQMSQQITELYANINYMALVMARVAARSRVNPLLLQYYLMNSWYARFSGIVRNEKIFDENPTYPSAIVLNWEGIREQHHQQQGKLAKVAEGVMTDVKTVDGEKKQSLKELMRKRTDKLDQTKGSIGSK